MSMKFKKGDAVFQIVPIIEGTVKDAQVVDGNHVQYLVEYSGPDGATTRWFKEEDLGAANETDAVDETSGA